MKYYSIPSHLPDKFPFIDRKMWEDAKMKFVIDKRQTRTRPEDLTGVIDVEKNHTRIKK